MSITRNIVVGIMMITALPLARCGGSGENDGEGWGSANDTSYSPGKHQRDRIAKNAKSREQSDTDWFMAGLLLLTIGTVIVRVNTNWSLTKRRIS